MRDCHKAKNCKEVTIPQMVIIVSEGRHWRKEEYYMLEIKGKYETAKVFTADIEMEAVSQIKELLNQPFAKGSHARFMPDVHAGKGCTVGTTMLIADCTCPNLVGVDIGCGMFVVELENRIDDFERLDKIIHEKIPSGMNVHAHAVSDFDLSSLRCFKDLNRPDYLLQSIGSLGGGNHFIEIDENEDGQHYLVIHSGSRNLGKQVCEIYMNKAEKKLKYGQEQLNIASKQLIERLKSERREREISSELAKLKKHFRNEFAAVNKDLATISGIDLEDYLHDMKITQAYAEQNREWMARIILSEYYGTTVAEDLLRDHSWQCIHNYIDVNNRILRKGSISAQKDEMVIIPLNMRDGCIIGKGKGNPDWNFSAPHGAGRKMSRSRAKQELTMDEFKDSMKDIYTTSVLESTIDEAPMAYKDAEGIVDNIEDTVEILRIVKPVYNFKASS